jgi:hypothetical protein
MGGTELAGYCTFFFESGNGSHILKNRIPYEVLVGKPKGKRPLGRPRHMWEVNSIRSFRKN